MKVTKDKKKCIALCEEFLEENGIVVDKSVLVENIYSALFAGEIITETELELDDITVAIALADSDEKINNVKEKIIKEKANSNIQNLIMLLLVESVEFSSKINRMLQKEKCDNQNIKVVLLGTGQAVKRYPIGIKSRIKALYNEIEVQKSKKVAERVQGNIYTASLYDIVELYNIIGGELFEKNVRLRVKKDNIGVASDIKQTLQEHPEQFWFLNNGITIVTNKPVDRSRNGAIYLERSSRDSFSVVNGAQTISACHEFFYCDGIEKDIKKRAKEALVLLRVVSVEEMAKANEGFEKEEVSGMDEKISKSLNRQKPIEAEDLAYYSPFVKRVNQIYSEALGEESKSELDNRFFAIIRRGENENEGINEFEYSLTVIARAVRASGYVIGDTWVYNPWKAINTYNADILKMNDTDLKHRELFDSEMVTNRNDFLKRYQRVNLAIYLFRKYSEHKQVIVPDNYKNVPKIENLKEAGSWYFVSFFFEYLLQMEKENKNLDACCVKEFAEKITDSEFEEIILYFCEVFDDEKGTFKNRELRQESTYTSIKQKMKSKDKKYEMIQNKVRSLYTQGENGDSFEYESYQAYAEIRDGKIILKKGSKISDTIGATCSIVVKNLRMENSDKIDTDGILKDDILFDDLSIAAKFVEGARVVNGGKKWVKK